MKALTLNELVKVLSTPDAQPMGVLMDACKQAAQFIRSEKVIYEKGAEFAKLFNDKKFEAIETTAAPPKPAPPQGEGSKPGPVVMAPLEAVVGQCNIFITGIRPIRGAPANRIAQLKALREASGDLNLAPRMSMQKANELLANLELGDQTTLIRTIPQMEEAAEIVKELGSVGIIAEVRS